MGGSTQVTGAGRPNGVALWWLGARPRTLPAAVVPVMVGAAVAATEGGGSLTWWRVAVALLVSLALQVGVNYANDYSDGVRGTDDVRVGPLRLVGSGMVPAGRVRSAALGAFGVAAAAGLALAATTSWWLLAVGTAALAAGWGYTGGPRPYGYLGLGEVFVFVFFGLVATAGTTYVAVGSVPAAAWWAGAGVGAIACALLVVNNLRDIPTDSVVGKRTLAVRMGDAGTRRFYVLLLLVAVLAVVEVAVTATPWALLGLVAIAVAVQPVRAVRSGATGRDLIPVLGATGRLQAVYGIAMTVGLVIGS
ncbi:MAG: 1,4-dihydroxy-2-naphthoate octaprenyltransferase [Actinomycetota bacterium]